MKGYFSRQVSKSNDPSSSIERLEFLLNEALNEDEDDDVESALALYTESVETGLKIVSELIFELTIKYLFLLAEEHHHR